MPAHSRRFKWRMRNFSVSEDDANAPATVRERLCKLIAHDGGISLGSLNWLPECLSCRAFKKYCHATEMFEAASEKISPQHNLAWNCIMITKLTSSIWSMEIIVY